jgi:hypothetical protein
MQIDQRNAGASVIFNSSVFSTDRWQSVTTQSSKLNAQQNAGSVTPPPGFSYYLGITVSSAVSVAAGDLFILRQSIEGYNIEDFAWGTADAQPVTLSFWVRSSLTGINSGALVNALSTRSYPFTFTISAASTWEYKTITVPGDTTGTWSTNNGVGVYLRFNLGSGSTFLGTSNSWNAGNFTGATGSISIIGTSGATFYITGVQLEAGSSATPFERLPIGETLMLCQRYFLKLGGSVSADIYTSIYTVNGFASLALTYPVTMRANATGTIVGSWTSSNVSGTPSLFPGNSSVGIQIPATVAPGSVTYYTSGTSTYLTFSAEL